MEKENCGVTTRHLHSFFLIKQKSVCHTFHVSKLHEIEDRTSQDGLEDVLEVTQIRHAE